MLILSGRYDVLMQTIRTGADGEDHYVTLCRETRTGLYWIDQAVVWRKVDTTYLNSLKNRQLEDEMLYDISMSDSALLSSTHSVARTTDLAEAVEKYLETVEAVS